MTLAHLGNILIENKQNKQGKRAKTNQIKANGASKEGQPSLEGVFDDSGQQALQVGTRELEARV